MSCFGGHGNLILLGKFGISWALLKFPTVQCKKDKVGGGNVIFSKGGNKGLFCGSGLVILVEKYQHFGKCLRFKYSN